VSDIPLLVVDPGSGFPLWSLDFRSALARGATADGLWTVLSPRLPLSSDLPLGLLDFLLFTAHPLRFFVPSSSDPFDLGPVCPLCTLDFLSSDLSPEALAKGEALA
jgi:hypothetical protein